MTDFNDRDRALLEAIAEGLHTFFTLIEDETLPQDKRDLMASAQELMLEAIEMEQA